MKVEGKQSCPTCGQSVNKRVISLYAGMVKKLIEVHRWCKEKGTNEFTRKDIAHLLNTDSDRARFSDWVLFGGLIYRPEGEGRGGYYGMNMQRVEAFMTGSLQIPAAILKDPLTGELEKTDYRTISEIRHIGDFLDENRQYIAQYEGRADLGL